MERVLYKSDGRIGRITLNRPEVLNALKAGDEPGLRLAVRTDVTQGLRLLVT